MGTLGSRLLNVGKLAFLFVLKWRDLELPITAFQMCAGFTSPLTITENRLVGETKEITQIRLVHGHICVGCFYC